MGREIKPTRSIDHFITSHGFYRTHHAQPFFNIVGKKVCFSAEELVLDRNGCGLVGEVEGGRVAEDDWDRPSPTNESSRSIFCISSLPVHGSASDTGQWSATVEVRLIEVGSKVLGGVTWSRQHAAVEPEALGHSWWFCVSILELLLVQSQDEEQGRAGDYPFEVVWSSLECVWCAQLLASTGWSRSPWSFRFWSRRRNDLNSSLLLMDMITMLEVMSWRRLDISSC